MAAPYPSELRLRVLAAYDRGMRTKEISEIFKVSPAYARRVKQVRREEGRTAPKPMGGATLVKIDSARLAELVAQHQDATLKELRDLLGAACGESAVCMALRRLKITFKKRRSTRASGTARISRQSVRTGWSAGPGSIPRS